MATYVCAYCLPTPELFTRLDAEVNWLLAKRYTNFIKQAFHNNRLYRVKHGQVRKRQLGNCLSYCSSFSIVVTAKRVDRFYSFWHKCFKKYGSVRICKCGLILRRWKFIISRWRGSKHALFDWLSGFPAYNVLIKRILIYLNSMVSKVTSNLSYTARLYKLTRGHLCTPPRPAASLRKLASLGIWPQMVLPML